MLHNIEDMSFIHSANIEFTKCWAWITQIGFHSQGGPSLVQTQAGQGDGHSNTSTHSGYIVTKEGACVDGQEDVKHEIDSKALQKASYQTMKGRTLDWIYVYTFHHM